VEPLVALRDLSVAWTDGRGAGTGIALHGISLDIDPGEVVGIVGETGSGRSTLLRCLIGIVPQLVPAVVEGQIEVAGRDPRVTPVAEMARDVAIVLDDPEAQISQSSVAEEVAVGLESLAVPVADMRVRVREMLEQVGLAGLEDRHPFTLSGGEQQRLAVACAVAVRPQLLLLDEPTANLDPRAGRRLLGLVRKLAEERGMTIVIVEQDVELLAEHVGRIVSLDLGRIRLDATPEEAFSTLARSDWKTSVPQVTEFAACLDPAAGLLPVTTEGAVRWLAGRA
jgi:energy-coupling factor transporter ATP-binding protein EcfA2